MPLEHLISINVTKKRGLGKLPPFADDVEPLVLPESFCLLSMYACGIATPDDRKSRSGKQRTREEAI